MTNLPGTLTIVPTPIGNLDDISLRALAVLKRAGLVACEDTRRTVQLLNHFDIHVPLVSFSTHNQPRRIPELVSRLAAGAEVALVSDGGMPCISDPGAELVRAAIAAGIRVVPLPGATAVIPAVAGSGLPSDGFVFLGFLKRKAGKMRKELARAAEAGKTIVFYESPYRVKKTLGLCAEIFGPETPACLAREISKKFEEFLRGDLRAVLTALEGREVLGECVVLIAPCGNRDPDDQKGCDHGED